MESLPSSLNKTYEEIVTIIQSGLLDILHTGIAFFSETGHFVFCNKSFLKMYWIKDNVIGKHISEVFLSAERGVLSSIKTKKIVICASVTTNNIYGMSLRYPIYDKNDKFCGIIVESIPMHIGKKNLLSLLEKEQLLDMASYSAEESPAKKQPHVLWTFSHLVGESPCMEKLRNMGWRFAQSREPILISGESGSGKELVAQSLHMASKRANGPFISMNCAAFPHELIESELFGYEGGAFTGAKSKGMPGKFELADTGTIFLDEVGELPLTAQAKLLRVLESGEIQKIGHGKRLYSDFRLICATNRNLLQMVGEKTFRADLYYRLSTFELAVPPLRERREDIPLLVRFYIEQCIGEDRASRLAVHEEVLDIFKQYTWHGNVRELKNTLVYALNALEDWEDLLQMQHLPPRFLREVHKPSLNLPQSIAKRDEYHILQDALQRAKYNKTDAAKLMGISRSSLYRKLQEYNMLGN